MKLCAYCHKPSTLKENSYGWVWICEPCGAWVGCHKGTTVPLGTLANRELRLARTEVHSWFDRFWREGIMSRYDAYLWLGEKMGLSKRECHIALFTLEHCKLAMTFVGPERKDD